LLCDGVSHYATGTVALPVAVIEESIIDHHRGCVSWD
jgi:hypothetical protein